MNSHPVEDARQTELRYLADRACRARRLATGMTDTVVRESFLELAFESEAKMEEIRKLVRQYPAGPERDCGSQAITTTPPNSGTRSS